MQGLSLLGYQPSICTEIDHSQMCYVCALFRHRSGKICSLGIFSYRAIWCLLGTDKPPRQAPHPTRTRKESDNISKVTQNINANLHAICRLHNMGRLKSYILVRTQLVRLCLRPCVERNRAVKRRQKFLLLTYSGSRHETPSLLQTL